MKKIQEELIKEFRKKFVVYSDKLSDHRLLHVPISEYEAFFLEWSDKLLAEERAECEHEPQIVTVTDNVPGGQYTHSVNGDVCSKCGELLT